MVSLSEKTSFDVEALRKDFPILATQPHDGVPLVYLDNAASTQRPRQVIDKIVETYEKHYANVHRGIHWLSESSTDLYEEARRKVQAFIAAPRLEEVVFTRGTTEGLNLVARSWGDANVSAGDEILLTELEHHSNIVPWQQLAERCGAVIRWVPISDDGRLEIDAFDALLNERTKIVSVAAVSNVLGTRCPVEAIARRAHDAGAVVVVDAAQSVPHEPTDVQKLGVDFLAFSGHKMLGPSGVGVVWGRAELLDAMPPFMGGGSMIRRVTKDGFEPADIPTKFEAGTPPIVPAIGLGAAIDYLQQVGLAGVHEHEQRLTQYAHERMSEIEGLNIYGPAPQLKAGIVSFSIDGVHAHDIAQLLDRDGVAVRAGHHCAMPLHERLGATATTRASFYLYNTSAEVDALVDSLGRAKSMFSGRHRRRRSG
ncbi:MAG: cysteine desulfurase [Pirellulales bacterium]